MPEVLTEVKEGDSIEKFKRDRAIKLLRDLRNCSPEEVARQKASWEALEQDLNEPRERARLEREVIEAAKAELAAEIRREGDHGIDRLIATTKARRRAVTALMDFESQHTDET